jgi:hypothetical protein
VCSKSNPKDCNRRAPPEDEPSGVVGAGAPSIARRLFVLVAVRFATNFGGGRRGPFAFKPETAAGAARGTATLLVAGTAAAAAAAAGKTEGGGRSESGAASLARTAGRGLVTQQDAAMERMQTRRRRRDLRAVCKEMSSWDALTCHRRSSAVGRMNP